MDPEVCGSSFTDKIVDLLKDGHTVQVMGLFSDNKNSSEIYNNSWDLVPAVAQFLNKDTEDERVEIYKCCTKLIDVIAEQSKPEEVLLQFIEELETANDDTKFLSLLQPLKKVLLRVPNKRLTSLAWCFNAIMSYLMKVETNEDYPLDGEERLLLDNTDDVIRVEFLYNELSHFCDTFIHELQDAKLNTRERRDIMCKFLIELLGKPLATLNFDNYKNTKPKSRLIAEKLMGYIFQIIRDPFVYFEIQDGSYGADLVKPNDLSLGAFYYLLLSERMDANKAPKVYDKAYIMQNCLKFCIKLLGENNQFLTEKGVDLSMCLMENLDPSSLHYLLLDSEDHCKFCKVLCTVIVHNELEIIRKRSLKILQTYIWAFQDQGRYLLILNISRVATHSGLKGYLVTQYKEMISQEYRDNSKILPVYYRDLKLYRLLVEFTNLRQKEETDLVDESDQIVSTLNFLRYIFLLDKTGELTGVDGCMERIDNYLEALRQGLKMSKAHYELRVKELNEKKPEDNEKDCQVSVSVSGKKLLEVSNDQKINIINMSLTTLDVIDSLLNRLLDCIALRVTRE